VKILITTGDADGIGLEVAIKALTRVGPQKNCQMIIWLSQTISKSKMNSLRKKFDLTWTTELSSALNIPFTKNTLICVHSDQSPAKWVEESAQACLDKKAQALVTGPLSKQAIHAAGMSDIGHTDILKRICNSKTAFMGFLGNKFNVVLATGHIPVSKVEESLTPELLEAAIAATNQAKEFLKSKKPVAVLGLNPHAGDKGIIGGFDEKIAGPTIKRMGAIGPLVPDVAFMKENWKKYSYYVALYHDQGLIPFKSFHGFETGVHLTLGLPIKRSSVDHGTAKDIFGKNKADAGSMTEALRWGIRLAQQKVN
jgi:4-hydroxythreonine-4-phosphate dehydrogenase